MLFWFMFVAIVEELELFIFFVRRSLTGLEVEMSTDCCDQRSSLQTTNHQLSQVHLEHQRDVCD